MSMIQFIKDPFPDNHDGFDYAPASLRDIQDEEEAQALARQSLEHQKKMSNMLASILK